MSWSYSTPDVIVLDYSDFKLGRAWWHHDIDESKSVGDHTYKVEPGFVVKSKTYGDGSSCSFVDGYFRARYAKPTWFGWGEMHH